MTDAYDAERSTPLQDLKAICAEIYDRWDKDMRSGKLLQALAGTLPKYRADVDRVRAALEKTGSIEILERQLQSLLAEERSLHVTIANLEARVKIVENSARINASVLKTRSDALRWISEQRWNGNACLDEICTRADREVARDLAE